MLFNQGQDNDLKNTGQLEKFSGIYKVWQVVSSFNNGRFEQTLSLLRAKNQSQQANDVKKANNDQNAGKAIVDTGVNNPNITNPLKVPPGTGMGIDENDLGGFGDPLFRRVGFRRVG